MTETGSIQTERMLLRTWREEDREPFARLNADPEVMRYFHSTLDRQESDAVFDRFQKHFADYGWGMWAVEIGGEFAGVIGLQHMYVDTGFPPAPEIGWRMDSRFWHQGYATEGASACVDYAFNTLELARLLSVTSPFNEPSWKVMERLGFTKIGMFDHPRVPEGHALRPHVVYELHNPRLSA